MTTWTCRAPAAALVLSILAGCEGGFDTSFIEGFGLRQQDAALSQARMAFGAVTLVAPSGFCIDKRSLKQQFALMARCDMLGVPSAAGAAPLGVITVSLSPGSALPTPAQTAAALELAQITDPVATETSVTYRAIGTEPLEGAGRQHWRGSARVGDQILSLALHGPEDGPALTNEGRDILSSVVEKARATP